LCVGEDVASDNELIDLDCHRPTVVEDEGDIPAETHREHDAAIRVRMSRNPSHHIGTGNGYRNCEMVQCAKRIWLHTA
jgi:hypothetical protein